MSRLLYQLSYATINSEAHSTKGTGPCQHAVTDRPRMKHFDRSSAEHLLSHYLLYIK